jgi:putative tricarboxylic transport membrane protein
MSRGTKCGRMPFDIMKLAWLALLVLAAPHAQAQWKPDKPIEIIVGSSAGGPLDVSARLVQKLLEARVAGIPVSVVNKTGGNHAIALAYLNQHPGNGHYLAMSTPNLVTNRIVGNNAISYLDVTPLAILNQEYVGMTVRADSPIKTGRDLVERLRKDPGSLSLAITFRTGNQHIATGTVLSAAGVDIKKLKFVSFKGGSEAVPAVLGGHVDVLVATPTSAWKHVQGGQLRMLAITSPQRLSGELAAIPTWTELGVKATSANWRGIVGPKGMTAPQIAYWDRMLSEIVKSAEWQEAARTYQWDGEYMGSAQTLKFVQEEDKKLSVLLKEMGDAK